MGWTGINTKKTFEEVYESEFGSLETLASSFEHWGENYSKGESFHAIRHKKGYVFALIILWDKDNKEVCYKEMDESVGPNTMRKCPKFIMDYLSPLEELPYPGFSKEWRERQ